VPAHNLLAGGFTVQDKYTNVHIYLIHTSSPIMKAAFRRLYKCGRWHVYQICVRLWISSWIIKPLCRGGGGGLIIQEVGVLIQGGGYILFGTPKIYTTTGLGPRKNREMAGVDDLVVYIQTVIKYNTFYIHHPGGTKRPRGGVYTNCCILRQFAYTQPNHPHQPFPYFF